LKFPLVGSTNGQLTPGAFPKAPKGIVGQWLESIRVIPKKPEGTETKGVWARANFVEIRSIAGIARLALLRFSFIVFSPFRIRLVS
jgi:hypothetical protein